MRLRKLQLERLHVRPRFALVALLVVGLAGCASGPTPSPGSSSTETAPYVGVFTGELVDGKPLYRLPTIEVVGSRSRAAPGT